jgi:phosphoribosylaminoimidazolecarboxamide formyltransferase/IMP cyclohydrolase
MSERAIRRALLSVWHKDGLVELGRFLAGAGVEILSTGGSARTLRDAKVAVRDVAEVTEFPEMMDGRVKTLHPRIHGGLLFRREVAAHVRAAEEHGIPAIDLLVVDLYPFEDAAARPDASREEVVEMIDIGGPAMIRAAAKNHRDVAVITDPADYATLREEMAANAGGTSEAFRRRMAAKAYARTGAYDAAIAGYLEEERFPERLVLSLERRAITRYGENPHQGGAVYQLPRHTAAAAATAVQRSGKELSYNNFLDAAGALDTVGPFDRPACAVIKHRNPCGAAVHEDLVVAFERAYAGDPLSAYGGILATNRPIEADLAATVADPERFFEVIIAPAFSDEALEILTTRTRWGRNVRLLETGAWEPGAGDSAALELRSISGGMLVQEPDRGGDRELRCVTRREPSAEEMADLRFAWEIVRSVTSNAIVFARDQSLVGCGAGQMSRVDSVEIAARKAGERSQGAVMASDAFFPFPDGILAAAEAGVRAVIQPGGSIRDDAAIAACDEAGLAMVLTGRRHFRH